MDDFFNSYKINDRSYVAFVKREIHNLAVANGFSVHRTGELDIIIAELTSNLIKYAGSGELFYRVATIESGKEIQIYSIDSGQGIANVRRMMDDGNSSANTLGQGLGSIKRLSNEFEIYSIKDWGTIQFVRVCESPDSIKKLPAIDIAALQMCIAGETVCGDGYHVKHGKDGFAIFVGDGLGHGHHANTAVKEAIRIFSQSREKQPDALLREIHADVRKTRGLVATIAVADFKTNTWTICGIGNISTKLITGLEAKTYTPYNGIVGHNIPRTLNNTELPYEQHQILVMHSDGIQSRWQHTDFYSALKHSPEIIAAIIYKNNNRGTDDSTVFIAKVN